MKSVALLWVMLWISAGSAQQQHSQVGTWRLDRTKSDFGSEPVPKSVSLTILADTPLKYAYRAQGADEGGKRFVVSWSGPPDGTMHPVMLDGKPSGQISSFKRESDATMIRHGKRADSSTLEVRISLSPDASTLTDELTSKEKDGKETREKQVWHRVDGNTRSKLSP